MVGGLLRSILGSGEKVFTMGMASTNSVNLKTPRLSLSIIKAISKMVSIQDQESSSNQLNYPKLKSPKSTLRMESYFT